MPRKKQDRKTISFRPATYDAAARLAAHRKEGMTAPPEYIRPSRVAPVDMPAQHMEF